VPAHLDGPEPEGLDRGSSASFREELTRAVRFNAYLRILFSTALLAYAVFGPGLLLRFPVAGGNVNLEPLAQFYAFRPVIFALLFIALVSVLAALTRRAVELFEAKVTEELGVSMPAHDRESYVRHFHPSTFPFVLSGQMPIDIPIFIVALVAYSLWTILLVETTPAGMGAHEVVGIILGSYGLFASLIAVALVWADAARRVRAIRNRPGPERPAVT
jgi:hypothetical protein